ncbi:hypothetical protein E2C01_081522 [Portunus trituberculatus]|uniref:Uncharacterized protein n=1 Tax=Portunus trituberculatus TaxID=210409 RepID=A0A5B7IYE6_PORTR|nr:hypothetical protein [Portunus trituberculatus]
MVHPRTQEQHYFQENSPASSSLRTVKEGEGSPMTSFPAVIADNTNTTTTTSSSNKNAVTNKNITTSNKSPSITRNANITTPTSISAK